MALFLANSAPPDVADSDAIPVSAAGNPAGVRVLDAPSFSAVALGRRSLATKIRDLIILGIGFISAHWFAIWFAWHASPFFHDPAGHCGLYGDVCAYRKWLLGGINDGRWPVIDYDWVYPVGALFPMSIPALYSTERFGYVWAWTALIVLLNAVAVVVMLRYLPNGLAAAWFWLLTLFLLAPTWLGRLDGFVAPLVVIAPALIVRRPAVAAVIAALGVWIKIFPAAVLLALLATRRNLREALRQVIAPAVGTTAVVVFAALAAGSGTRVFSVLGKQAGRGLQIESVAGTWHNLSRLWSPAVVSEYSRQIATWEFRGPGTELVARLLDPLLIIAVLAISVLLFRRFRLSAGHGNVKTTGGTSLHEYPRAELVSLGALALMTALIVFNKVGSPQFIGWLGPCVAAGIGFSSRWRRWLIPAALLLLIAGLTRQIFPYHYPEFIAGDPRLVIIGALRNLALVGLLAWAVLRIIRKPRTLDSATELPLRAE
jgi:hypothetical protein